MQLQRISHGNLTKDKTVALCGSSTRNDPEQPKLTELDSDQRSYLRIALSPMIWCSGLNLRGNVMLQIFDNTLSSINMENCSHLNEE